MSFRLRCFSDGLVPEKFPIMDFYLKMADRLRIVACPDAHLELLDVGKLFALNDASLLSRNMDYD